MSQHTLRDSDGLEFEKALAERHKPLLVLYPEIGSEQRVPNSDWRASGIAPLNEDYHPRSVRLVLDHSRSPGQESLHDADRLLDELDKRPRNQIDILQGVGHADRKRFWTEYYRIVSKIGVHAEDQEYPPSTYVHVVYGDAPGISSRYRGLIAIEYWFLYIYNDWKSTHEGDWEVANVFLRQSEAGDEYEPVACAYSAHHGGYRSAWSHVEKANDRGEHDDRGEHPVVYVAQGSHANYFFGPGRYSTTTEAFGLQVTAGEFPFTGAYTDFTTSAQSGHTVWPNVEVVPLPVDGQWTGEWRWLNHKGQWGTLGIPRWLQFLHALPRSVRFRLFRKIWGAPGSLPPRSSWSDPFSWADEECDEAPRLGSWLVG